MRLLAMFLLLLLVTGCSRLAGLQETPEATLAELQPVRIPAAVEQLPQVTLQELAQVYREVLAVSDDPETRLQVLHRLADIEMLEGEAALVEATSADQAFFTDAILAYETLLQGHPGDPRNDQLLYQLSRAYELNGDTAMSLAVLERLSRNHPDSAHTLEAEFRKAESYFVAGQYPRAERAYRRVIDFGSDTPYYTNALYMHGWTRFKQGQYRDSIASFSATLDQLLAGGIAVDTLPRGERELVQDCLRVVAVTFSYLEGADSIAEVYAELGVRPYQHLLYGELGDLYRSQERFRDSAETFKAYTRRYPDSRIAHLFQMRVIQSYDAGGFPDLIVAEKQHYVDTFGVTGAYWSTSDAAAKAVMRPQLKLFIRELASYFHALAQADAKADKTPLPSMDHYRSAASYYQLYIDSFPQDPDVPYMGFLLAESRFEARDYAAAIAAYEWVAYQFRDHEKAADAGYAALLAYQRLAGGDRLALAPELQRQRVDSELQFASVFSHDARATAVLGNAAAALLEFGEYQQAIIAAATLQRRQPVPADETLVGAWLVMAHSHFELQQFTAAEQAYLAGIALMAGDDPRREGTVERVAASIYRQGEEAVTQADHLLAAEQFSRVMAAAPGSTIAVKAHYDAASNFMQAGQYDRSNSLFLEFRRRYPAHELTAFIAASLVSNYEALAQWQAAALELDGLYARQNGGQREALYLAAQYYDRAGNSELAIQRYRSYAHNWPQPVAIALEAMNRLAELYVGSGQDDKQRYWLRQIVSVHEAAGEDASQRSLLLAAAAASTLAEHEFRLFSAIGLHAPLEQSLPQKKQAMERALAAYGRSHDYGVRQFSTLATYRMASIYEQFSHDLMRSERPQNIDTLALEQYELLLEEQAYPFEERAIAIHESNARRSWEGHYDEWVKASFVALGQLLPARYHKLENGIAFTEDIY